jgi:hypothetical protein
MLSVGLDEPLVFSIKHLVSGTFFLDQTGRNSLKLDSLLVIDLKSNATIDSEGHNPVS